LKSTKDSCDFLPCRAAKFLVHPAFSLMNTGSYFSVYLTWAVHLEKLGIRHMLTRPYTPRHNGKVERSHRKDNEEFYASENSYLSRIFRSTLLSGSVSTTAFLCVPLLGFPLCKHYPISRLYNSYCTNLQVWTLPALQTS
jgi:transposase InsO family protein